MSILAASSTSVRGPHVPSLKLDEIDEIDTECREAAMGMCMSRRGQSASVVMTSTWHRLGGPMARLIDEAKSGSFPLYSFCTFEVLERCPDERSGPALENCPSCPIQRYCHDVSDGGPPGPSGRGALHDRCLDSEAAGDERANLRGRLLVPWDLGRTGSGFRGSTLSDM